MLGWLSDDGSGSQKREEGRWERGDNEAAVFGFMSTY